MEGNNPYRATQLWNEIVADFQREVPCKKHRHQFRSYETCFTGSEAVSWLYNYLILNPNIEKKITRGQAVLLLDKFLTNNIIKRVINTSVKLNEKFKDNSTLYRLVEHSKKPVEDFVKECKPLAQINPNVGSLPSVTNQSVGISYLRAWKEVAIERLSLYLGGVSKLQALLDTKFIDGSIISHNCLKLSRNGVVSLVDKNEDLPNWVFGAMKYIANWPQTNGGFNQYLGFEVDVLKVVKDYFESLSAPLIPPYLTKLFTHVLNKHDSKKETFGVLSLGSIEDMMSKLLVLDIESDGQQHRVSTPLSAREVTKGGFHTCFETAFNTENPTTKLVCYPSEDALNTYRFACNLKVPNRHKSMSRSNLSTMDRAFLSSSNESFLSKNSSIRYKRNFSLRNSFRQAHGRLKNVDLFSKKAPLITATALKCYIQDKAVTCKAPEDFHAYENTGFKFSPEREVVTSELGLNEEDTHEDKDWRVKAFQICTLFLPPSNRRHLHLLMRMMTKMTNNERIEPFSDEPMDIFLINMFLTDIVIGSPDSKKLVTFLLKECDNVFTPPEYLKQEVISYQDQSINWKMGEPFEHQNKENFVTSSPKVVHKHRSRSRIAIPPIPSSFEGQNPPPKKTFLNNFFRV